MARINEEQGKVSFVQSIKDFWIGYFDFRGRSTRVGFLWTMLIFIIGILGFLFQVLLNVKKASFLTYEVYSSSIMTFF